MGAGRCARAAAVALAVAILPGAIRLLPDAPRPDRPLGTPLPAVAGEVAYADEVAIAAPTSFSGPIAPAAAPPAAFEVARGGGPTDGGVYALVVGIDDYPGASADLTSAVADADTIDAALTGFGVPAGHRVVLRDGQARKAAVVAALAELARLGGPTATLVFAFAGHARQLGGDTQALVTADGELLTDAELADLLRPTTAEHVWLLLATCFAGGFTEPLAPGRVLTAAAGASSLAYESPALRASYLVHHLVREGWLQGQAGPSVAQAFAYADARLAAERPERRPVQIDRSDEPIVLGPGDPRTAAGLAPMPEAPPASTPAPPPPGPPTTEPPPPAPPTTQRRCTLLILCGR